jgi:hypothetical protein
MTIRVLRACAILIASAGAIDPAVTSARRTRPMVAVVAANAESDLALSQRVAKTLSGRFDVIQAPYEAAAATVLVGNYLPPTIEYTRSPAFAVLDEHSRPVVRLQSLAAPARAHHASRVRIDVIAHTAAAAGRTLEITLRSGVVAVDRVERAIAASAESFQASLAYVPGVAGVVPLRVEARIVGEPATAADLLVEVVEERWSVLFFDRRPSWMSTFVRRALERDPRFEVSSRVMTSRNVSTAAGRAPQALDDAALLELVDVVVVGAPDALAASDVEGLERFLRGRAGTVLLLFDRRADGPYERLTRVGRWLDGSSTSAIPVRTRPPNSAELRATSVQWPVPMPAGAQPLAWSPVPGDTSLTRPVVWQTAVGAGRLVVSGALDAWKFRDPSLSTFDAFWSAVIADGAQAATPPIEVGLTNSILRPGETTDVSVTMRESMLAQGSGARAPRARLAALLHGSEGSQVVRFWPAGPVGAWHGPLRAPARPGEYRLSVVSNGNRVEVPIVIAGSVARPARHEPDLVRAWATSRAGTALPAARINELPELLQRALEPAQRTQIWHPMRSGWWILPFALLLGAEWWLRRRKGLP